MADNGATTTPPWTPQHRKGCDGGEGCQCPQVRAYNCEADVIGYGGQAGGGKTDYLLGKAGTQHHRSIIFRREFPRLEGIIARSREIFAGGQDHRADSFNESLHRWTLEGGARTIQLAAMQYEDDKNNFQGRPYDFYGFDEVTEFSESQVRFVTAWNRSTHIDPTTGKPQRCQVAMTFNPPMTDAGEWVTRFFAPWLDENYPHPAQDGELRWFAMVDGREVERPDGQPFEHDGVTITPRSRTFFHAGLKDNPILAATNYAVTIDALPEPLRSFLKGNFKAARVASPWQVIPRAWVLLANERWRQWQANGFYGVVTDIGNDVGGGGEGGDASIAALACDRLRIRELVALDVRDPMQATMQVANMLAAMLRENPHAVAFPDVIGIGAGVVHRLAELGLPVCGYNAARGTTLRDRSGNLGFANWRAAGWWILREMLDPALDLGACLPPDDMLTAELVAPTYSIVGRGLIQIEEKVALRKRLGRSTDRADAVIHAVSGRVLAMAEREQVVSANFEPVHIGNY